MIDFLYTDKPDLATVAVSLVWILVAAVLP